VEDAIERDLSIECGNGQQGERGARRVIVTLLYNILLFVFLSVIAVSFVSTACVDRDLCSGSDRLALSIIGGAWLVLGGSSIILGWTGRLPGCRPRNQL
jgi:hypothetical protein